MTLPGSVLFEDDETDRIDRAQLALLLHKTPMEIDCMPELDGDDVMAVHSANNEIAVWRMQRK